MQIRPANKHLCCQNRNLLIIISLYYIDIHVDLAAVTSLLVEYGTLSYRGFKIFAEDFDKVAVILYVFNNYENNVEMKSLRRKKTAMCSRYIYIHTHGVFNHLYIHVGCSIIYIYTWGVQ